LCDIVPQRTGSGVIIQQNTPAYVLKNVLLITAVLDAGTPARILGAKPVIIVPGDAVPEQSTGRRIVPYKNTALILIRITRITVIN